MGEMRSDVVGLAQLHRLEDMGHSHALWRRGMATLAALSSEHRPVALEGLSPSELLASVRIALSSGYFDQLDWLSPAAAAVAIFEIAAALPKSEEKRELGRRVLTALHQGNAETFTVLATALALGSSRSLSGPQIHARVSLCLSLPLGMSPRADALALALISRADMAREWLTRPSTGSLPARRLAARLLERAAREAIRRARSGDDAGVRVFDQRAISGALTRLLTDRESLVWRHAAAARGLLSEAASGYAEAIEYGLMPELTATEWRRAAVSLAARCAIAPEETVERCSDVLYSEIVRRDSGVVAAMISGLGCAVDAEREAAEELLGQLVDAGDLFAVEAFIELRNEYIESDIGESATRFARAILLGENDPDDGKAALKEALYNELVPHAQRMGPASERLLHDRLLAAHRAFAQGGPAAARAATDEALEAARDTTVRLERQTEATADERRQAFQALRELDRGILESTTLVDLLTIRTSAEDALASLERIRGRLGAWLLSHETAPVSPDGLEHSLWHLRRLRTLLHLVDADEAGGDDRRLRERRLRTLGALLSRVSSDGAPALRRIVCATLARTLDALVREQVCELSDIFIATTMGVVRDADLHILEEASMAPSFKSLMSAYVAALHALRPAEEGAPADVETCLKALRAMVRAVPIDYSPRVEALRTALLRFAAALASVHTAGSLAELAEKSDRMSRLETSADWLAYLVLGALERLDRRPGNQRGPRAGQALRKLDTAVERAARGDREHLERAAELTVRVLGKELPPALAEIAALIVGRIPELPATAEDSGYRGRVSALARITPHMAPWLPLSNTVGGFYILRALGKSAVGSVFVGRRSSERSSESAPLFALKVPEYSGSSAHVLSEDEYVARFVAEAASLPTLPEHPNLGRIVSFMAHAKPKPILVMEFVEGPTLARVLEWDELPMPSALAILDGIAAGIEVMHLAGIAYLDLDPANIIMRDSPSGKVVPVLVDFGRAGHHIRPGCAEPGYGAPEIWAGDGSSAELSPLPADVYAFACIAYQLFTGRQLFTGDNPIALMAMHMAHDGAPAPIQAMHADDRLAALGQLLSSGLRRAPEDRATIGDLRRGLLELGPALARIPRPLRDI